MENDGVRRINVSIPDVVVEHIMHNMDDFELRNLLSQTRKEWRDMDSTTRKHITIPLIYASTPEKLKKRFPKLKSLKLKGKPRAAKCGFIPENWGGNASPWIRMIQNYDNCLNSLHFKRMIVSDHDLSILAERGKSLFSLVLDNCSGFTTKGLEDICRSCTNLRVLFMEESSVSEKENEDGKWLHELALNNKALVTLNFFKTDLFLNKIKINIEDLELLAKNCPNLASVKITDCEILDLKNFFRYASSLEEFCGGFYNKDPENYASVLPARLSRLGLVDIRKDDLPIMFPSPVAQLKMLDLRYSTLDMEDHCTLIRLCPNLETLKTMDVIGNKGLIELGQYCKKLKRLRIETENERREDEEARVTQRGLIAISNGCPELEYISVNVSNITNQVLIHIGTHLKNLCDFRLTLLNHQQVIPNLPLDDGVKELLQGCVKLRRFALYLRSGGLTDKGLEYIGRFGVNLKWILLGYCGQTDEGLLAFSRGCPSLQKLEIRGCKFFSEVKLGVAASNLKSLRYLWVQSYSPSFPPGSGFKLTARPYWFAEMISTSQNEDNNQFLGYYSIAGPRADVPHTFCTTIWLDNMLHV